MYHQYFLGHRGSWHAEVLFELSRWRFSSQEFAEGHWVSVALGPLDAIVDAWGVSLLAVPLSKLICN